VQPPEITVETFLCSDDCETNLISDVLAIALDQRAFGPRRLVVVFAAADGQMLGFSHSVRTEPPESALRGALDCFLREGVRPAAAVAFCDEMVEDGPPPADVASRFARAREVCAFHGVHLVDWFCCDDLRFRSASLALEPREEWWDLPAAA
jgi:hypothetical protein